MHTEKSFCLAVATIGVVAVMVPRSTFGQETLAWRILKWSDADQTAWINSTLDQGIPPDRGDVLPMLVLDLVASRHGIPGRLTFLHDAEVHARFLVALPVLIMGELIVHSRLRPVVQRLLFGWHPVEDITPDVLVFVFQSL